MNRSILIVDDERSYCEVLARALARHGWQVSSAHTPEAALELVQREQPARCVLDLNLAGRSGLLLLPRLRGAAPDMQILLLTGYASIGTAVEAIKLGAVNYLAKPADAAQILAAFELAAGAPPAPARAAATPMSLRRLTWEHIQRILNDNGGNVSAAARQLGLHRRTLQRRLRKRPVRS